MFSTKSITFAKNQYFSVMNTHVFSNRHIGPRDEKITQMLDFVGVDSIEQLIKETVPNNIRLEAPLSLPEPIGEYQYSKHISKIAEKNKVFKSYIGLGYHQAIMPAVIQRNILENPGWYTAYTPYQAEIAQGRLEALLNFQTMVCDLTQMDIANASLLDEATASAEAMTMLYAVRSREKKKNNANKFFVSENVLPQTLALLETRSEPLSIELVVDNPDNFDFSDDYFGVFIQHTGKKGEIRNHQEFVSSCKAIDIKVAVAADIMSLVLIEGPGAWGVDVVVGTTQRFGIPLGYGGPHAAFFATKQDYKRNIPGRIIGVSKDIDGNRSLRMALQTREQHIKRDRATSNICTAQVLLAVMAGMYSVFHGPNGLKFIAEKIHNRAVLLQNQLEKLGFSQKNELFFDTIQIEAKAEKIKAIAEKRKINFYYPDKDIVCISINEITRIKDLNAIVKVFADAYDKKTIKIEEDATASIIENDKLERVTPILQHEVFNSFHSETELMRYIKSLERKDLSLNHSMISLGSCTMKLNAAAEMLPLSDHRWGNIHPFAPVEQAKGYHRILIDLEKYLTEITGFAATSLQPNSGAQGEYAGLMVIRAYHESRGDSHRNICLVPSSAHGTNPASAVMAGMKVVVVKANDQGNVDVEDLKSKAEKYKNELAALMVTYPSTHGVYESSIKEITQCIHDNGGQVYMDGANMNAQVGVTSPGAIGADVCHLNLHKTFAIPHGGGGPGVGPICVAKQLAPFLPGNPVIKTGGKEAINSISAAPWGSSLACLISYAYIRMLGEEGLRKSTEIAILNANYIKERLRDHYPTLYTGERGRAAHEFIIDCRPFKKHGIEVVDIAKRLIDYGFHAPTVSFPVAGTMMIEPTESESKAELDRFCEAMISIKNEIDGCTAEEKNNPLKNAPHTLKMLTADEWSLPYSRNIAAFPISHTLDNKFWPTTRRVDEGFGDRNLVCTCNPIEDYLEPEEA